MNRSHYVIKVSRRKQQNNNLSSLYLSSFKRQWISRKEVGTLMIMELDKNLTYVLE